MSAGSKDRHNAYQARTVKRQDRVSLDGSVRERRLAGLVSVIRLGVFAASLHSDLAPH